MSSRLWMASLVVCGLFVAEDPGVIAVRAGLDGSPNARIMIDLALATAMVGYNFAASRFVVSIASAPRILDAMSAVDQQRGERIDRTRQPILRFVRRVVSRLNPFDLIKVIGERVGRSLERATSSARHRRFHRVASGLEDLSVVNLLGVPGAGLALASGGHSMTRGHSLRQSVLFVASWFVGIRCIEWFLDQARRLPALGTALTALFGAIGTVFATLTDVRRPIGAIFVAAVTLAIVRYSVRVERTARLLVAADRQLEVGSQG